MANSVIDNSDLQKFGPSQFKLRPLVNSDLNHWSIRTSTTGKFGVNSDLNENIWSDRTFSFGQFGPFYVVNSDIFLSSIWTLSFGQFEPFLWSIRTFSLCILHTNATNKRINKIEASYTLAGIGKC